MGFCAKHGEFNDFVNNGECPNCEYERREIPDYPDYEDGKEDDIWQ